MNDKNEMISALTERMIGLGPLLCYSSLLQITSPKKSNVQYLIIRLRSLVDFFVYLLVSAINFRGRVKLSRWRDQLLLLFLLLHHLLLYPLFTEP